MRADATRRAHAFAEGMLERHGVVTRGAVVAEKYPGGFAAVYRVLRAFEDSGRARRGYFVAGLGAAQFATAGAVDRLRSFSRDLGADPAGTAAVALAASDPANPYGAALPWPARAAASTAGDPASPPVAAAGHRPGRKAGALVVLVDGELAIYVERGGRTLLTFTDDPGRLRAAACELAAAVRRGALGKLTVERADGGHILAGPDPLLAAMSEAGFAVTPRGLRMRG